MMDPVRVVLVPGFTQTAASWDGIAPHVPDAHAVDVPRRDTFAATAAAIGTTHGRACYVGYSMGGRLCLRLALERPELVAALALVSTTPGIADATERAARVAADEELARTIERDGVETFLDRWLAQPMFAGVAADAPGVADRRRVDAGTLTHGLRVLGAGTMEPLWDRLGELRMPVAVVTGTRDPKYTAIGAEMAGGIPGPVTRAELDGGHALPQERPAELAACLASFVAGVAH